MWENILLKIGWRGGGKVEMFLFFLRVLKTLTQKRSSVLSLSTLGFKLRNLSFFPLIKSRIPKTVIEL